jgi:hypothetical protein
MTSAGPRPATSTVLGMQPRRRHLQHPPSSHSTGSRTHAGAAASYAPSPVSKKPIGPPRSPGLCASPVPGARSLHLCFRVQTPALQRPATAVAASSHRRRSALPSSSRPSRRSHSRNRSLFQLQCMTFSARAAGPAPGTPLAHLRLPPRHPPAAPLPLCLFHRSSRILSQHGGELR